MKCGSHPLETPCIEVSGRVVFDTNFSRDVRMHVVLASEASVSLPGLTSVELPPLSKHPPGFGFGDWVSVIGRRTQGSHGEWDIHAIGFETDDVEVRCRWVNAIGRECRTYPR